MRSTAAKTRILLVEDDPPYVRLLRANLTTLGYKVLAAPDGLSATALLQEDEPDLVILDIMLPDIDGFEVCKRIRQFSGVPIIILTAKGDENDKVLGFELGADDYLTKPFGARELLARVQAVLRRLKPSNERKSQNVFAFGDLSIDTAQCKVAVRGQEVNLSPTEYRLLCQLVSNRGRVLVQDELLKSVWGPEYQDETEILRVCIRRLRQKVEPDPSQPTLIITRRGIGYLFAAE
ncbi:MAG: response regulator transcription factor [Dehalococcoidales bacterium]|nr:response regulator transcription factor [Dehalococcoidales bacterium]